MTKGHKGPTKADSQWEENEGRERETNKTKANTSDNPDSSRMFLTTHGNRNPSTVSRACRADHSLGFVEPL